MGAREIMNIIELTVPKEETMDLKIIDGVEKCKTTIYYTLRHNFGQSLDIRSSEAQLYNHFLCKAVQLFPFDQKRK